MEAPMSIVLRIVAAFDGQPAQTLGLLGDLKDLT